MFRLLILEDAAFAAWYGQGLPLSQDGLPYIRADAVSDGPAQAPPMAGTQPVMVGRQPSPLPLGIGRIPEEDRVTVGVTARSVFDQRVPDPVPRRSLVVYYDAADGRLLTPRLAALLDAANCRYTIQDYTPTSDWARQRQAIGLLLAAIRACFPPGVLLLGGLETFTVLYAQLPARRREFALLRSLGLPERTLYGTVFATGAFCLLGGVLAGLAGGATVSALIARALALPWAVAFPPWGRRRTARWPLALPGPWPFLPRWGSCGASRPAGNCGRNKMAFKISAPPLVCMFVFSAWITGKAGSPVLASRLFLF